MSLTPVIDRSVRAPRRRSPLAVGGTDEGRSLALPPRAEFAAYFERGLRISQHFSQSLLDRPLQSPAPTHA